RFRAREMRRAGRKLPVCLAGGVANKDLSALDRTGSDPGPHASPCQMCDRYHGLNMDLLVGIGQYLVAAARSPERKTRAAGAPHSERVPFEDRFERIVFFQ